MLDAILLLRFKWGELQESLFPVSGPARAPGSGAYPEFYNGDLSASPILDWGALHGGLATRLRGRLRALSAAALARRSARRGRIPYHGVLCKLGFGRLAVKPRFWSVSYMGRCPTCPNGALSVQYRDVPS